MFQKKEDLIKIMLKTKLLLLSFKHFCYKFYLRKFKNKYIIRQRYRKGKI